MQYERAARNGCRPPGIVVQIRRDELQLATEAIRQCRQMCAFDHFSEIANRTAHGVPVLEQFGDLPPLRRSFSPARRAVHPEFPTPGRRTGRRLRGRRYAADGLDRAGRDVRAGLPGTSWLLPPHVPPGTLRARETSRRHGRRAMRPSMSWPPPAPKCVTAGLLPADRANTLALMSWSPAHGMASLRLDGQLEDAAANWAPPGRPWWRTIMRTVTALVAPGA